MSEAINQNQRRTTMIPVTTMEEVPILSEAERAEMIASLKAAEARIAAGQFVVYDPQTFRDRFIASYWAARNAQPE